MANHRRVIRKVTSQTQLVVDEQFWPVILSLFVLCGFSMGAVVAYFPFGARRWWLDATTWLFVLPVATCIAIWFLRYLPSRIVRRVLQISFVLCLVFHLIMLVVSVESNIFNRIWEQRTRPTAVRQRRQPRVVSVYQAHQLEQRLRQQQEFTRPVETTIPEPVQERVERAEETRTEPLDPQPPMPAPQTQRDIQPSAIERPTPAETRPRQSEDASKLSRQVAESRPQPNQPIRVPLAASPQARSSSLEARGDGIRQQLTETQADRVQTAAETAAPSRDTPMIAHRANERAPTTDTRSAPMLPRQLAQPTAVPLVDVATGETPAIARRTAPGELEPARTTTQQQLTASPRSAPVAELTTSPQLAPTSTPTPRREQPSPTQPQLAQTPVLAANRQPRATTRPEAVSAAATLATNAQPDPAGTQNIEATAVTIGRQATTQQIPAAAAMAVAGGSSSPTAAVSSPTATRQSTNAMPSTNSSVVTASPRNVSATRAANPAATSAAPIAANGSEASTVSALSSNTGGPQRQQQPTSAGSASAGAGGPAGPTTTPSIAMSGERAQSNSAATVGTAESANHLVRSARSSQVATSTRLAQTPSAVSADAGGEQPDARPSRLAMSQSLGGIAGVGQTANLDRSPSTPSSPSTSASGSARRAEATQNLPPGPALAPSSSSLTRRSLVGSDRPSASLRASTSAVAEAAGSNRPGELNATSGASQIQQAANAPAGAITAAKGNVDIDLGPTRIADAGGFERASGGGQPVIHFDNDGPSLARSQSGGQAPFAVATTTVDAVTASPSGTSQPGTEISSGGSTVGPSLQSRTNPDGTGETAGPHIAGTNSGSGDRVAASTMTRSNQAVDVPAIENPSTGATGDGGGGGSIARSSVAAGPGNLPFVPSVASVPSVPGSEPSGGLPTQSDGGISRQVSTNGASAGQLDQIAASATVSGGDTVGAPSLQRAEAVDAVTGPAVAGGGTSAPQRSATAAREFPTNVTAETMTVAGSPASGGSPTGSDIAAQGGTPSPTASGTMGRPSNTPVGAVAGDMPRDATPQGGMDLVAGSSQRSSVSGDSPAIGDATTSAAPIARSGVSQFNASTSVAATPAVPSSPTSIAIEGSELKEAAIGSGSSLATQQSTAALPIEVAALDGPGGLGDRLTLDVGVNSRLASTESIEIQATPSRFMRQEVGGAPQLNTSAVFAADAFRNRGPSRSDLPNRGGGGTRAGGPQTEEAVELGLTYLSRRQLPDGSWTLLSTAEPVQLASDTAATGLCLLAFQGAGYNHREFKYKDQVSAGIEYLIKNQKSDGDLFVPVDDISNRSVWLYSHGIASIALCEAYGMTQDPKLKEPAQRALDFIIATQDTKAGGWRYQPGVESDTSVTGWMMMALKSGELAGLKVPRATYDNIGRWLDHAQGSADEKHLYRYNPNAPDTPSQRHGRSAGATMTAVGLLMRLYDGWRRDHPAMISGAEFLRSHPPSIGTAREPLRDTYYWYYGTQVMFHMGGSMWEEWNGRLHPLLIESQIKQGEFTGSWSPRSPVPDRWAPHAGRLYVTTLNLLSLEVTYRHLPLYVDTAK